MNSIRKKLEFRQAKQIGEDLDSLIRYLKKPKQLFNDS